MERDTWHYHRPELAERYLRRFDPGPAEALTLFAERRSGKTAFLQNDLGVVALDQKLQPVYIDLWSNRADPGRAIADGLEAAARRVKDPRYKYGAILGRMGDSVENVGAFGFSLGFKKKEDIPAPTDTIARMGFWADQLVANSKRPIVLMVDEAQSIAEANNGKEVASALRSILLKHGRESMRPVFTGSSRDGLNRMFNQSGAAFFHYGSSPDFESPDDGIAKFFAERMKESSGIEVSVPDLTDAFNALERRPGPFREMCETMDNDADPDVGKYLQRQLGALQARAYERVDLARLKPLDMAVMEQMLGGDEQLFGQQATDYFASRVGVEQVNPKSINDSLSKLRNLGLITRLDRGVYAFEDRDIAIVVLSGMQSGPYRSTAQARLAPDAPALPLLPAPTPNPALQLPSSVPTGPLEVRRLGDHRAQLLESAKSAHGAAQDAFWATGDTLPALRQQVAALAATEGRPERDALDDVWAKRHPALVAAQVEAFVAESPEAQAQLKTLITARSKLDRQLRRSQEVSAENQADADHAPAP